jgi:hypothetical protein
MHGKKWCTYWERKDGTVLLTPIGFLNSLSPFFFSPYPYYFPLDTTYSPTLMMEAAGSSRLYGVII